MKVEWLITGLNAACFLFHLWQWKEPGKVLYWLGATILMVGLLRMKG